MEKISVVIPNYNGADLLAVNLPNVIKFCPNCEIIVVDDASTDGSIRLIHKKFKKVKLVQLRQNGGFANASNVGAKTAKSDLILLMNTDVSPRKDFLRPALKYFKNANTFSVGLEDQSHENGKIIPKGRGSAVFRRGFLMHFAATTDRGVTLWTSGGSSIFNRKKFLELGGFDLIYKPFYWEDIDLGFRAWRKGYVSFFEPLSKVDHYHEKGSITKSTSSLRIKSVSYKNQFLFVWKNIHDYYLIAQHFIWLPYHLIKALINWDTAFYYGFLLAILSIPKLLETTDKPDYIISDKEVIEKFKI